MRCAVDAPRRPGACWEKITYCACAFLDKNCKHFREIYSFEMTGLRQAGMAAAVLCALLLLAFSGGAHGSGYCWDHQQKTYNATFKPGTCGGTCTVTPFFSPDTSLPAYVQLIDAAQTSIDIYTPSKSYIRSSNVSIMLSSFLMKIGMKSWDEMCTKDTDCPDKGSCTGCPIEEMRNETFPIFPALLNAVHERGVKVRIITNNFTFAACESRIIPLDWFALNKIEIRMYNTTTFQHAKYIMIDKGKKTAVSSVNWSQTSFLMNREAGVILEDCTCSAVSDLYHSVFEQDWTTGINYVISRTYTDSEMKIITDPAHMPYSILPNNSIPGVFVTQLIPHRGVEVKKVYASPDSARETLMDYLDSVQKSLHVSSCTIIIVSQFGILYL